MKRAAVLIRRYPVSSFFALTYLFSWPLFLLVFLILPGSMALQGTAGALAVFAPALAAILVARTAGPDRVPARTGAKWISGAVSWLIAWVTLLLYSVNVLSAPLGAPVILFGGVLALLPAFTISRAFSSREGVRRYFRTLALPRGHIVWYLVALFTFPVVQLAGVGLTRLFGGSASLSGVSIAPLTVILIFLYGFFFAGGINEESGWRGFALPRLQERFSPLAAALIVWVFWALWHLPADLASGDPASAILTNRLFYNAMWSILFMWVFNRTGGSLLAPALFHPAMNTSGDLLPGSPAATALFAALVLFAVVKDGLWRRPSE
jgi:membrane protease YdiL (CAAX protease family)